MKFKKNILFILIFVFSLFLSGCFLNAENYVGTLNTPTFFDVVEVGDNKIIQISETENASGYNIVIDDVSYTTHTNYLDCTDVFLELKNYSIKVRSISDGAYKESEYSEIFYYSNTTKLTQPNAIINDKTLTWNVILNANSYTLKVVKLGEPAVIIGTYPLTMNRVDISNYMQSAGAYAFYVNAVSTNERIQTSDWSQAIVYQNFLKLSSPTGLRINKDNTKTELVFSADSNSQNFALTINNEKAILSSNQIESGKINLEDVGYDLSEVGEYVISLQALGYEHFLSSDISALSPTYTVRATLNAPEIMSIQREEDYYYITWTSDSNCKTYVLYINSNLYRSGIATKQILLPTSDITTNSIVVYVIAEGYDFYDNSLPSESRSFNATLSLNIPTNIHITSSGYLTFDAVTNANAYLINIDGVNHKIYTTYVDLRQYFTIAKIYTLKIKSIFESDEDYAESLFSEEYEIAYIKIIEKVDNLYFGTNKDMYKLYFDIDQEGAESYQIMISKSGISRLFSVTSSPVDLTNYFTADGVYTINIRAMSDSPYYLTSTWSDSIECQFITKLSIPSNVMLDDRNGYILTFDPVYFASSYTVTVNSTSFTTTNTTIDLTQYFTIATQYNISVQANANANDYFTDSDPYQCDPYDLYIQLDVVQNFDVVLSDNAYIATFGNLSNCQGYQLYIFNTTTNIGNWSSLFTDNPYDFTNLLSQAGNYLFRLRAVGITQYYLNSETASINETIVQLSIADVTGLTHTHNTSGFSISWNASDYASGYEVYVNNTLVDNNYQTTSILLNDYVIDEGQYTFKVIALGSGYYANAQLVSITHNYTMLYQSDFARKEVFMYGNYWDYDLNDYENFENVIWQQFLFRDNTIKVFITSVAELAQQYMTKYNNNTIILNTTNNIILRNLVSGAINEYPEYAAIGEITINSSASVYNISFVNQMNLDNTTTFTTSESENPINFAGDIVTTYSDRASNFEAFAINTAQIEEVIVSNSEQLFMVVQYGARPVFTSNCVAKTIYDNAKQVLREIISNDMDTYEKIVAIFDYVQKTNVYDFDLLNYIQENSGSVTEVGHYKDFYLEGILLDTDNAVSVCDGIAKTFVLLCRIEGIEAIKINGSANGGNHAWAKVKYNGNWYIVDATWADQSLSAVEYVTHWYFMESDANMTSHSAYWPIDSEYVANESLDYYETKLYSFMGTTQDYSAKSQLELNHLISYIEHLHTFEPTRRIYEIGLDMGIDNEVDLNSALSQAATLSFSYYAFWNFSKVLIVF
ncbi:MAG: transglutaminase domain-containing protein [Clostridia bacterium]|nr:transglutaminase domain-containing protein [Clostridia bacterium]